VVTPVDPPIVAWEPRAADFRDDIQHHLALDAAALEQLDAAPHGPESLRFWEVPAAAVVVGRASRVEAEVDLAACRRDGVPVVRRSSGGAAVLVGPGCLLYSLVLSTVRRPALRHIDAAHRFVLARHAAALQAMEPDVSWEGTSDLAWRGRKFSGNSLRCRANAILYHGTLLYDFPIERVSRYLRLPPRRPEYRGDRSHEAFLTNFPAQRRALEEALSSAWGTVPGEVPWPGAQLAYWLRTRFTNEEWNLVGRERSARRGGGLD